MKQFFISFVVIFILIVGGEKSEAASSFVLSGGETLFGLCNKVQAEMPKDRCSKEILFANKDWLGTSWATSSEVDLTYAKKLWANHTYHLPESFLQKEPEKTEQAQEQKLTQEETVSQQQTPQNEVIALSSPNNQGEQPETSNPPNPALSTLKEDLKKKDIFLSQIKEENFNLQREVEHLKQSEEALKTTLKESATRLEKLNVFTGVAVLVALITSTLLVLGGIGFLLYKRNLKKHGFTKKRRIDTYHQIIPDPEEEHLFEETKLQRENESLKRKIDSLEEENKLLFERKVNISVGGEVRTLEVKRFIRDKWGGIVPMVVIGHERILYKVHGKKIPRQYEEYFKDQRMAA